MRRSRPGTKRILISRICSLLGGAGGASPLLFFGIYVKPQIKKYFALSEGQIRRISIAIPSRSEGRRPSSRTWDGDAVDADGACDDGARRVRQRRVVLTSRCWRQCTWRQLLPGRNGGKRAVLRGEHVISRKAIAQGMSDVLRCPVCSCAAFFALFAHEIAGAARIRHSLRPLI